MQNKVNLYMTLKDFQNKTTLHTDLFLPAQVISFAAAQQYSL